MLKDVNSSETLKRWHTAKRKKGREEEKMKERENGMIANVLKQDPNKRINVFDC